MTGRQASELRASAAESLDSSYLGFDDPRHCSPPHSGPKPQPHPPGLLHIIDVAPSRWPLRRGPAPAPPRPTPPSATVPPPHSRPWPPRPAAPCSRTSAPACPPGQEAEQIAPGPALEPAPHVGGRNHQTAIQDQPGGIGNVETGAPGLVAAKAGQGRGAQGSAHDVPQSVHRVGPGAERKRRQGAEQRLKAGVVGWDGRSERVGRERAPSRPSIPFPCPSRERTNCARASSSPAWAREKLCGAMTAAMKSAASPAMMKPEKDSCAASMISATRRSR